MAFHYLFKLKMSFFSKKCQSFQELEINHKIETTFCRYMYKEGFANFLVILSQDIFTLVKIRLGQKCLFGDISKT